MTRWNERIPAKRLSEIVHDYLMAYETWDMPAPETGRWGRRMIPAMSPIKVLAEKSGVGYHFLEKFHRGGHTKTVEFWRADALLCAMDLVHLWRQDPELKKHYLELEFDVAA